MQYPRIDQELIGKKIVSAYSLEDRVFTAISINNNQVEAHRSKPSSTWAYFGLNEVRLATTEEIIKDQRFKGSCPHRYRSYLEIIKAQRIPPEHQEYFMDYSKPSMMSVDAWVCDWCGQHIDRDTGKVLKEAIR